MKQASRWIVSTLAMATLAACGGGGGGDSGPQPYKYSASDVQNTATIGVAATERTGMSANDIVEILGAVVDSLAFSTSGSQQTAVSLCSSGTTTADVLKPGVYTGFAVGDQVTLTFSNCTVSGTANVLDGVAKLTLQTPVFYSATDYSIGLLAELTDVVQSSSNSAMKHNGVLSIQASLVGNAAWTNSFAVTAGNTFQFAQTAAGATPYQMSFGPGTTFSATDTANPATSTRKLDGLVTVTTSAGAFPVIIATPTALSGSKATGAFVASAGVIDTTATLENMATTTSFNGATAHITGDSDGNGSQETVLDVSSASMSVH
jgi:hypothetical protein